MLADLPGRNYDRGDDMTEAELAILNSEIINDPFQLGYSGKSDPEIAAILNAVNQNYSIDREAIDGQELQMAVVKGEWDALVNGDKLFWQTIISAGSGVIAVADSRVKVHVAGIWAQGTTTRANLIALQTRAASRAEVVFQRAGMSVSMTDVAVSLGRF